MAPPVLSITLADTYLTRKKQPESPYIEGALIYDTESPLTEKTPPASMQTTSIHDTESPEAEMMPLHDTESLEGETMPASDTKSPGAEMMQLHDTESPESEMIPLPDIKSLEMEMPLLSIDTKSPEAEMMPLPDINPPEAKLEDSWIDFDTRRKKNKERRSLVVPLHTGAPSPAKGVLSVKTSKVTTKETLERRRRYRKMIALLGDQLDRVPYHLSSQLVSTEINPKLPHLQCNLSFH